MVWPFKRRRRQEPDFAKRVVIANRLDNLHADFIAGNCEQTVVTIRDYRNITGCTLYEARDVVDSWRADHMDEDDTIPFDIDDEAEDPHYDDVDSDQHVTMGTQQPVPRRVSEILKTPGKTLGDLIQESKRQPRRNRDDEFDTDRD